MYVWPQALLLRGLLGAGAAAFPWRAEHGLHGHHHPCTHISCTHRPTSHMPTPLTVREMTVCIMRIACCSPSSTSLRYRCPGSGEFRKEGHGFPCIWTQANMSQGHMTDKHRPMRNSWYPEMHHKTVLITASLASPAEAPLHPTNIHAAAPPPACVPLPGGQPLRARLASQPESQRHRCATHQRSI
jgi:hypothetical protein